ncbi:MULTISPECIES: DUF6783 domain-containing protein [Blautia]|nr:DUF6783 domain-containing protein [Blautia acetigignens]MEE0301721.1 DUF6783 domain-containing protein [Blautia sp.]
MQIAGMIFQTRSSQTAAALCHLKIPSAQIS